MRLPLSAKHFLFSILLTLLVMSLFLFFGPQYTLIPLLLANPCIYLITFFWGFFPALVSIILWTLGLAFFFFLPRYSFHITSPREMAHLFAFVVTSVPLSLIIHKKRIEEILRIEELQHQSEEAYESRKRADRTEELGRLKDQFVNTLSHDLRNPLSVARLSCEMVLRSTQDELVRKNTARTLASLGRIDSMVSNLLDSRRISLGNPLNLRRSTFNLYDLLVQIQEHFGVLYKNRVFLRGEESEVIVDWDRSYVQRALENLINNALKYGDPEREIDFGFTQEGVVVDLWVRNYGAVLTAVEREKIFRPFERLEALADKSSGWGIGLPMVEAIARAHGGAVSVESDQQKGTIFHLRLKDNPELS